MKTCKVLIFLKDARTKYVSALGENEHLSSDSEILIFIALVKITKTVKYYEYCHTDNLA